MVTQPPVERECCIGSPQPARTAGGGVLIHNTLVSSDYSLLDENDFTARPNYWVGLLWLRLMGATVLDSGIPIQQGLHVYAHYLREVNGGVALLVINNDRMRSPHLALAGAHMR